MIRVLFVCLANVCRSPMAEAVFSHLVRADGLEEEIEVDSAGTAEWEMGSAPHPGTQYILEENGIAYSGESRRILPRDLDDFDYIITMDDENLRAVSKLGKGRAVVAPLMSFVEGTDIREVPDPYFDNGFEVVYRLVGAGAEGLLDFIKETHQLNSAVGMRREEARVKLWPVNPPQPWRSDPHLQGRFHVEHPNDLQVIVHEGGPRLTKVQPELMWVQVVGQQGRAYEGELLNAPHNLRTLSLGSHILFLALPGVEYPFRVTEEYLAERENWNITGCNKCGFSELFDAPSQIIGKLFPNMDSADRIATFTTFCPLCGGVQVVEAKESGGMEEGSVPRKWWRFWK